MNKLIKKSFISFLGIAYGTTFILGCDQGSIRDENTSLIQDSNTPVEAVALSVEQRAKQFIEKSEKILREQYENYARNAWVQANFITFDTEILAASASEKMTQTLVQLANEAKQFNELKLSEELSRKIEKIKLTLTLPAPSDAAKTKELAKIESSLSSIYGAGKYCKSEAECLTLGQLSNTIATSRNPEELLEAWLGWRTVSQPMREKYTRMVELANEGSIELGFADTGHMWRSKYDMEPDAFSSELDRLWNQVKPLYDALHCHVRSELNEHYGSEVVNLSKPIPAHLLGNMWAQSWGNIYPLVKPEGKDSSIDVTEKLQRKNLDAIEMVKYAEKFFTSLGFEALPQSFWERSLFVKPQDRDVQCHASAWNIDSLDDLRIKMCIQVNGEDFVTIHHELGHNFYQRAYNQQSILYQQSANDGFHEAIGDTIALSVTPDYLQQIDLIDEVPSAENDLGQLMRMALDKIAFLPFGLMIDQWRWKVFNGEIKPDAYNQGWWNLRTQYQGVMAPTARSENDFDPGAKYHIPANTPYSRYFLAHILQFQFHRDLCKLSNYEGPLHRCSIYNNKTAGKKIEEMLTMGSSQPWPEALAVISNQKEMDATAILDYFAPLKTWLDEQNAQRQCGW